jgi:hypothetical protein
VDEYLDKLTDHCICKISCMCLVEETKQTFANLDELRLRKPHLTIKVDIIFGYCYQIVFQIKNKLCILYLKHTIKIEVQINIPGIDKF